MRRWLRLGCLLSVAACSTALAQEGIEYGFGTGRDGMRSITSGTVNPCSAVRQASATIVELESTTGFTVGDLVLFHHTQATVDGGALDLSTSTVGRYFFRRIVAVVGTSLRLDRAFEALTAGSVQAVRVFEPSSLSLTFGQSIVPPPWNGRCGGIIALLVRDSFSAGGGISACGRGFRGAAAVPQASMAPTGCIADPTSLVSMSAAPRGEGLLTGTWGVLGGTFNTTNGGGGGVCRAAGGGGGGNVGAGGTGGLSLDLSRPVGGMGGESLVFDPLSRAFFGGGGGAGQQDIITSPGGNGGGFIWIRAGSSSSGFNGDIRACGADAVNAQSGGAGAGAGGTIVLQFGSVSATDGDLSVEGGAGGSTRPPAGLAPGPGGGGGGGHVFQWAPRFLSARVSGGAAGSIRRMLADGGESLDGTSGARSGSSGVNMLRNAAFTVDSGMDAGVDDGGVDAGTSRVLRLTEPASDVVVRQRRPRIVGEGAAGVPVTLTLDGQPLATLAPGLDERFEAVIPFDLADGAHSIAAQQGQVQVSVPFRVDVQAPAAPVITSPRTRAVFSESPGVVRGTAEAGSTVRVFFDDGPEVGSVQTSAMGEFVFVVPVTLEDGLHSVAAVAEDVAGNVSERSEAVSFKVTSKLEQPGDLAVRNGCSAMPGALLVGLALFFRRLRKR